MKTKFKKLNWIGILNTVCFLGCLILLMVMMVIVVGSMKAESRHQQAEIDQLQAELGQAVELIDAYQQHNQAVGSFLEQAADTLEAIAYGPYSRQEVQELITQVADILKKMNQDLEPAEVEEISQTIVTNAISAGVDPVLLLGIAITESNCRPLARGKAGEYGMLQVMPNTGRWIASRLGYGEGWQPAEMLDVRQNIQFAVYYLRVVTREFGGDVDKGLLAYNRGSGGARAWLQGHDAGQFCYVRRVKRNYSRAGGGRP